MRFRIREIRETTEVREISADKGSDNYRQIKPETNITVEECRAFLDSIFGESIIGKEEDHDSGSESGCRKSPADPCTEENSL